MNVSVDAAPSTDLMETLKKIREHYEELVVKNRKSLEVWIQKKVRQTESLMKNIFCGKLLK